MTDVVKRLANLINVKTLVTFAVTAVFSVLALRGTILPDTVMSVVVMVLGFYFGTQFEQNNRGAADVAAPAKLSRPETFGVAANGSVADSRRDEVLPRSKANGSATE